MCIAFPWQSARQTTRPRPRERREREILVTIAKRDESPSPSSSPCPSLLLLLLPLFVPNNFVVYAIYSFLSAVETKKASVALKRGWGLGEREEEDNRSRTLKRFTTAAWVQPDVYVTCDANVRHKRCFFCFLFVIIFFYLF